MKKRIAILLIFTMVFGLCACTGTKTVAEGENASVDGLQVGYAKIDITPNYTVGISGYSNAEDRPSSDGLMTYIYATCIAITAGEETILVYTVDNIAMENNHANNFRSLITEKIGIPGDKIFFGATHSHSCPAKSGQYKVDLANWLVEGAEKALADRAPVTMYAGTQEIPGMNFVRHYKMADGTYAGSNFGDFSKEIVDHATEKDDQMVLVKFDYADENKKDVLLVNWQAHPDSARDIGYNTLAASWVGPLRDEVEKLSGMRVAYFTGAAGNQNMDSKIESEAHGLAWDEYGVKMGQLTFEALSCLKPAIGEGIKTQQKMFTVEIDHSWDHMLAQANEVFELWKSAGISAGNALGKTYGFTSSYQARAIRSRAGMSKTAQLELGAFSVGGVGFTTGTYEMFSNHSLYVKEHSPFGVTFIITGCSGYIPDPAAYDYRSYEADTGYYASGTGEKLAEEYAEMLKTVQ